VGAVGLFLWLALSLVGGDGMRRSLVTLVCQGDQAGGLQLLRDAPDPGGLVSWTEPGSGPETQTISPAGPAMTCGFMPCLRCLPK
jgi:hypothetical protein